MSGAPAATSTIAPGTSPAPETGTRDWTVRASYTLGFLTLISTFNYLDRSIFALLLPLIQQDMQVSDTVVGLVSGLAFVLFYSVLGVPIAWAADRWNRRNIIALGFAFWSLMTLLTGFVHNIWQLAFARFLMGAGEASCLPPSQSIIADSFPARARPFAISVFGTAFAIASILFLPVIGWVGEAHGWRAAFATAGVPGMTLALIFFLTVREPSRGAMEGRAVRADPVPLLPTLRFLAGARTYVLILSGVTISSISVSAAGAWSSVFLVRVHDLSITQIAGVLGPVRGILGFIGVLVGGYITDRLGRRDPRYRLLVPAVATALLVPSEMLFLLADRPALWLAGFAGNAALTFIHQAPVFAVAMSVAQVRMRATAVAIVVLGSSLVGFSVGPLMVGMIADALAPSMGEVAIRWALLSTTVTIIVGATCFYLASRSLAADVERADAAMARPSV